MVFTLQISHRIEKYNRVIIEDATAIEEQKIRTKLSF